MTEKVLSIIVPVYNTEIYLKECLDSLLDQGLKGYEIICINDGSTDNSLAVLEEYQKNNPVIKVYSQTNKGLSATRNRGLSLSQGKYIYFMDSDDVLTSNFLSKAIEKMMNQDLEIYSFDAVSFIDCSSDLEKLSDYGREKSYGYYKDGKEFLNELCRSREFLSPVSLNIIDSNLLRNNDISFIEGILHEDEAFTVEILLYASQVFHTNQKGYKRRIRQNSIMTTKKQLKILRGIILSFCD
ncbi:glycosyltransferase, group 2 family protein [Aerococcus sp. Group 1]|uniref:glycosyltransferase n=1 Tax=Aerococcus urinae (strain CCUG 59500 / ACS-120-V-Col10a) TaxID=2976812 RepID=UPI000200E709|nr:glycosyltransferase [Aerococcus sp. Group 1]AEA00273.1 glycosyltransferase, group 2 family protein [Aerococcus sp. Group 1]